MEQTSTSPGELSGSATKLHSYPYKFREIIKQAKQLAQCGAATDPFPSWAWFIGEKCSEYIAEVIAEYEEKGVLIPPGEYYATVSLHFLTTDRVLAAVEPPGPLRAQPRPTGTSKSHAMHRTTRATNSHTTWHQVSQPFPCAPAPRLTARLISHTSGARPCARFAHASSAIARYTSASNPTQLVDLLRAASLSDRTP